MKDPERLASEARGWFLLGTLAMVIAIFITALFPRLSGWHLIVLRGNARLGSAGLKQWYSGGWGSGSGSSGDSGSFDSGSSGGWDSGSSDSGSSGGWDSGGSDSGSWDSGGSDSGSWD